MVHNDYFAGLHGLENLNDAQLFVVFTNRAKLCAAATKTVLVTPGDYGPVGLQPGRGAQGQTEQAAPISTAPLVWPALSTHLMTARL